ncbi:DUF2777 family protein [Alteribacillus bidgolensis]|uniref:DUF2777 family protein n=1 Tax=Alteribacillus bidgolensis TaxID=930129 RepID=A0A1G8CBU9_9BACI|nr:DUF2777 family protein [Alteribacillus bidgolensis]SDH42961.1 Protein of unknown function [Alteribacillus bidgolensis]
MNRTEATKHKGSTVLVDKGIEGVFYGRLDEVFTPPKKAWSGKVFILGVAQTPELHAADTIDEKKNAYVTVPGSKIHSPDKKWDMSFNDSVVKAIQTTINELYTASKQQLETAQTWKDIGSVYGQITIPSLPLNKEESQTEEQNYIYYQIQENQGDVHLIEPTNGDTLELEGCPFELEIQKSSNIWVPVTYKNHFTFQDHKGKEYKIKKNDSVRIHKEQFQPFTILLNELEHPARKSLWQRIHSFGFERTHLEDCHNRLLYELLQAEGTSSFKGVNFLTFRKPGKTLLIQHHYERILRTHSQDYVFDRFECTTDSGERSISTYTNAYSKDYES